MIIRYNEPHRGSAEDAAERFDPCWVEPLGIPVHVLALRLMCRPWNSVSIEFLPVMSPTDDEVSRPDRFAARVRDAMAAAMDVGIVESSFTDTALMFRARKLGLSPEAGYIAAEKVLADWGMGMGQCKAALELYASVCATREDDPERKHCRLSPEKLVSVLWLHDADPRVFASIDRAIAKMSQGTTSGTSFREFLACIAAIAYASDVEAGMTGGPGARRRFSREGEIRALFREWLLAQ